MGIKNFLIGLLLAILLFISIAALMWVPGQILNDGIQTQISPSPTYQNIKDR